MGWKDEEEEKTLLFKAGGAGCDPRFTETGLLFECVQGYVSLNMYILACTSSIIQGHHQFGELARVPN